MDKQHLSAISIQELGEMFTAALQEAAPDLLSADLEGTERHLQRVMRPVVGRVVEAVLATVAATQPTLRPVCASCGAVPFRLIDPQRERHVRGLVGDDTLRRPSFVCDQCHRGRAPSDERLGLGRGSLSPGLSRVDARLGLEGAFGEGVDVLAEALGVDVAKEGVRRITEGLGAVAEAEQLATIAAARQGEIPSQG